MLYKLTLLA